MGPAGLAAVALWALAAAPSVDVDAAMEVRSTAAAYSLRTPVEQPLLEARPSLALRLESPRTRTSVTYAPWLLLADPGGAAETGTMQRIDAAVLHSVTESWSAELRAAGAAGVTPSWHAPLGQPLQAAPTALLIRREQAQLAGRLSGLLGRRASLGLDASLLASQGSAPTVRVLHLGATFDWLATARDRLQGTVFGEAGNASSGHRSAALAVLGGPSRRLTPSADGSVQAGVAVIRDDAPGLAPVLRIAPAAAAVGSLRSLEDRLTTRASLRIAPESSSWDGRAMWRTELAATSRAVVNRSWSASLSATGAHLAQSRAPAYDLGELLVSTTWAAPGGRAALTGGFLARVQRGGGMADIIETGVLFSASLVRVPLTSAPPGAVR